MASLGNEKYDYLIGCHLDFALNSRSRSRSSWHFGFPHNFNNSLVYWKPLNGIWPEWTEIYINFLNTYTYKDDKFLTISLNIFRIHYVIFRKSKQSANDLDQLYPRKFRNQLLSKLYTFYDSQK